MFHFEAEMVEVLHSLVLRNAAAMVLQELHSCGFHSEVLLVAILHDKPLLEVSSFVVIRFEVLYCLVFRYVALYFVACCLVLRYAVCSKVALPLVFHYVG